MSRNNFTSPAPYQPNSSFVYPCSKVLVRYSWTVRPITGLDPGALSILLIAHGSILAVNSSSFRFVIFLSNHSILLIVKEIDTHSSELKAHSSKLKAHS